MRISQQPAFVLHARPYRETSLLLECLTRDHGRLGVVARGVRSERARGRRAQLEPFQPLLLDLSLRGELATLTGVEPTGSSIRPGGDAGLAGLYLNELVVRLTARQDAQPALYAAYATTLQRLAGAEPVGWTLRRFERDLLQIIGYAMPLQADANGDPLQPASHYRYVAEVGAMPCAAGAQGALRGEDLLALGEDRPPSVSGLASLRRLMREVIRHHLGGRDLHAWQMLAGMAARR